MADPKAPERTMLTRGKAAQRLGVSIATFRRKYEQELPEPDAVIKRAGREVPVWRPQVIEEVMREEHPPMSPEEEQAAILLAMGEAAGSSLTLATDSLERTSMVVHRASEAILKENTRLTTRVETLEAELGQMRKDQREFLDHEYKRQREDREAEVRLRTREAWHKQGVETLAHLAPATMALVGKQLGIEMPMAQGDAITRVFAKMDDKRMAILQAEVANSQAFSMEEKVSLAMALHASKEKKPDAEAPPAPSGAPGSLDEREADLKRRFAAMNAEADKIAAEASALAEEKDRAQKAAKQENANGDATK